MSDKETLIRFDLSPLVYDRQLNDITFFYKCLYGEIDLNVHDFVSYVTHGHTRLSNSFNVKTSAKALHLKLHILLGLFS